jgi:hypothetical protein
MFKGAENTYALPLPADNPLEYTLVIIVQSCGTTVFK